MEPIGGARRWLSRQPLILAVFALNIIVALGMIAFIVYITPTLSSTAHPQLVGDGQAIAAMIQSLRSDEALITKSLELMRDLKELLERSNASDVALREMVGRIEDRLIQSQLPPATQNHKRR